MPKAEQDSTHRGTEEPAGIPGRSSDLGQEAHVWCLLDVNHVARGLIPGSKIRLRVWSSGTMVMLSLRTWKVLLVWGQNMSLLGETEGVALKSAHL